MKVLKFGGTSVGKPERMHAVAGLIQNGSKNVVVLSAVSGTTNALVEMGNLLVKQDTAGATLKIVSLETEYRDFVSKLYSTEAGKARGNDIITAHFQLLKDLAQKPFGEKEQKIYLAQGELISTHLFQAYLQETGVKSALLPALEFMKTDADSEPVLDYIEQHLTPLLVAQPDVDLFITQGYICRNHDGEIDNLKRGGSDYTATLIGAAIRSEEIQIWTDIDGMHNNDPRIVKNTFPIAELSFDEAAELAYFGAKILHPTCILPAQKRGVPVRLLNTMQPTQKGTVIANKTQEADVKAIAAKDGIIAIKIKSSRMLLAYGFLRKVFEVFERYKTPIDVITTSEVAVSVTIDDATRLDAIVEELKQIATVEVETDLTIVCIVGNFSADAHGLVLRIFESMKNIPIRMISYGGSKYNTTLLVKQEYKAPALQALNEGLFQLQTA